MVPGNISYTIYDGLATIPPFDPCLDNETSPAPVIELRNAIASADAVIICTPEYAFGVPGQLKNALDWLVGSFEFPNKPVVLINTSPRATHALAALTVTLETMSARLVKDASITLPLLGTVNDAASIAANAEFAAPLRSALERYVQAIRTFARDEARGL